MAKVLLIEDETSLLEVYKDVLESDGHTVMVAADGDAGYKAAVGGDWEILFLDIMLPGMDGISLLKTISSEGLLKDRKVVILSNLDNPEIINEAIRLGASETLTKAELTPGAVSQVVSKYIKATSKDK